MTDNQQDTDAPAANVTTLNVAEDPRLDDPRAFASALQDSGISGTDTPDGPSIGEIPWNEAKARGNTRETITLWLIGLLCTIVGLTFVALFAAGYAHGFEPEFLTQLKAILDVLLGPVITLLSTAIGFYFGYQQGASSADKSKAPL